MQGTEIQWSEVEENIAQIAFKKAYERETTALITEIREQASAIAELGDIWCMHDFLSAKRHEIDGKYDYSYSALIFVFARLIKDGWLNLSELEGIDTGKLAKIAALTRM
jgi:hypothetical protein